MRALDQGLVQAPPAKGLTRVACAACNVCVGVDLRTRILVSIFRSSGATAHLSTLPNEAMRDVVDEKADHLLVPAENGMGPLWHPRLEKRMGPLLHPRLAAE